MPESHIDLSPGLRVTIRGEDFLVTEVDDNFGVSKIIKAEGISELVKGQSFIFDTSIDSDINVLDPINTKLVADDFNGYQRTKLFIESHLRNANFTSNKIEIAHKAAINPAPFQFDPTLKSFNLPRPRILIADAVGLGKTIEAGIFLAEQIKRGRGQRILVLALKSILSQFQQEIWSRFAIPLIRLDSLGIARIKAELPANKNPFDYYDKTIISIDTLKNNAKFRHYIEKSRWDIIVIDECHTVANLYSQRGDLAQFLATKCESLVLTSATPHNGRKESFANLITLIEPTAIPKSGEYTKHDVQPYYVRRFKKDIEESVRDNFKDREVNKLYCELSVDEESFLRFQQMLKINAITIVKKEVEHKDVLFSITLFKSFMSSPEACLESIENRIDKIAKTDSKTDLDNLIKAKDLVKKIINNKSDSKYNRLIEILKEWNWKGRNSDERIIIFTERIATLKSIEQKLKSEFRLSDNKVKLFYGALTDIEQQELIDDFGKEDSEIRILLTSDAGAQGVNLHYYCNKMFNYDVPWSIITLEQRNGRIDRYGQKNTPYIYYLLSVSETKGLKTDLHIIEKLSEKEDEIHKTLGDAASFLRQYDSVGEESIIQNMIIKGDDTALDNFKWESLFGEEGENTEVEIDNDPISKRSSFFESDFDFYKNLIGFLKSRNSVTQQDIEIQEDGFIEVLNSKELDFYLYSMPAEAKCKRGSTYKLTSDKDLVQKSIEDARKKKGLWPKFHMLYDLHPIVKTWMNKLEANIDKDVALVAKTNKIPINTRWYVFHAQVSNNLGQSVLSEFLTIGLKVDGSILKICPFDNFNNEFNLSETLYNEEISISELESLKVRLKFAIDSIYNSYLNKKQSDLQDLMLDRSSEYLKKLNEWHKISKEQIEIEFELTSNSIFTISNKERRVSQIETILNEKSQYFKDMASLDNKAFLKLLAVFFN